VEQHRGRCQQELNHKRKINYIALSAISATFGTTKMHIIRAILQNSRAATAIEYGLIAALIAIAAIAAFRNVGTKVTTTFNNVATNMKSS
jgi:pilus assembly protein Flp/PilA